MQGEAKFIATALTVLNALAPRASRGDAIELWRAQCVVASSLIGLVFCPLFGVLYYFLNDPVIAGMCWASAVVLGINLLVFKTVYPRGSKTLLVASMYLLLLGVAVRQGGSESPSLIWLAMCPLLAFATMGRRAGVLWSMACFAAIIAVNVADVFALFPPVAVTNMHLVSMVSTISLLFVMALVLLAYDKVCTTAITRLDQALVQIHELAERDELTGVHNRRKVLQVAGNVLLRSAASSTGFCVCMLDIDHFKRINDNYGHQVGDEVLRQFAARIQKEVRASDCFGRYGGEEFLLLLEGLELSTGRRFAERIREMAENMRIPSLGEDRSVTVSIGIAQYKPGETIEQIISRADAALYDAKHMGRNRVAAAGAASLAVG